MTNFPIENNAPVAETFSVMVLAYKREDGSRNWVLDFRSQPRLEVILTGDVPTRDELTNTLMSLNFPVVMIAILESVIGELTKGRYVQ